MAMILQLDSVNRWGGDGVTTDWDFSFSGGYIDKAHVKAYVVAADRTRTGIPVTSSMFVTPFRLRLPVTPVGAEVTIFRDTPKDLPLVEFEDGTAITEPALNLMARQAVFIAAEFTDATTVVVKGGDGNSLINALDDIEDVLNSWVTSTFNTTLTTVLNEWKSTTITELQSDLETYITEHMPASVDLDPYGYKEMRQNAYTNSSVVTLADRGKAHTKLDSAQVNVPSTLPVEFTCNIINLSGSAVVVAFNSPDVAYMQGATYVKAVWSLPANQMLHMTKAAAGKWLISGFAT